jgi:hypothetical protein
MLNINVKVIPHRHQRYPTVGDWWYDNKTKTWEIRVSAMGDWRYEALVALHEQHEVLLAYNRYCCAGIMPIEALVHTVDTFDIQFEKDREKGIYTQDEEPGDNINSPYRTEHFFATTLERLFAAQLGVDWEEYDKTVMSL